MWVLFFFLGGYSWNFFLIVLLWNPPPLPEDSELCDLPMSRAHSMVSEIREQEEKLTAELCDSSSFCSGAEGNS